MIKGYFSTPPLPFFKQEHGASEENETVFLKNQCPKSGINISHSFFTI
jgi:hypothetical protein